jgi:uncharacterized membrane protein
MSVKQQFLNELRANLRKYPSGAVDDYVDYYDELITERVANGEKEADIVRQIGSPKHAATSFKRDNALNQAIKKPTVSNGFKALIAVLGVLSLPFLIPVVVVMLAMLFAGLAVFAAGLAVLIASAVAAVVGTIEMTSIVLAGDAPIYLLFLVTGIALIVVFLVFELMRSLLKLGRWIIRTLVQKLKARQDRKKQQDETSEEQ